jgi:acyl-homoserine-lactone acylase
MTSTTVSVDILMADVTMTKRTKTFYFSKQGAVVEWPALPFTEARINADPSRKTVTRTE